MHDLVMFSSIVPDFYAGLNFRVVELEPSLIGF